MFKFFTIFFTLLFIIFAGCSTKSSDSLSQEKPNELVQKPQEFEREKIIEDFELISNNINSQFIEIGRKGFNKTLSDSFTSAI